MDAVDVLPFWLAILLTLISETLQKSAESSFESSLIEPKKYGTVPLEAPIWRHRSLRLRTSEFQSYRLHSAEGFQRAASFSELIGRYRSALDRPEFGPHEECSRS